MRDHVASIAAVVGSLIIFFMISKAKGSARFPRKFHSLSQHGFRREISGASTTKAITDCAVVEFHTYPPDEAV